MTFEDGAVYSAVDLAGSSLTAAAPEAFGFIDASGIGLFVTGASVAPDLGVSLDLVGSSVSVDNSFVGVTLADLRVQSAGVGGSVPLDPATPVSAGGVALIGSGAALQALEGGLSVGGGQVTVSDAILFASSTGFAPASLTLRGEDVLVDGFSFIQHANSFFAGGGTFSIAADDTLTLEGGSFVGASAADFAGGANLELSGAEVEISDFTLVDSVTSGLGPGGDIRVTADDVSIGLSLVRTTALSGGDGGDIRLTFGSAQLTDSLILSESLSAGFGGDLLLSGDTLGIDGVLPFATSFGPTASLFTGGVDGFAGDIIVDVGVTTLGPGAAIESNGFFGAPAGFIIFRGDELNAAATFLDPARISATSDTGNVLVLLDSDDVTIGDWVDVTAGGFGGDAQVTVDADSFTLAPAGSVFAFSQFNVAGLSLLAGDVDIGGFVSTRTGAGDAETLVIQAGTLLIRDTGGVSASSEPGDARAGINISADSADLDGLVFANSALELNGGAPNAAGGSITITATDFLRIGAGVGSLNFNDAEGGSIFISAPTLVIEDGLVTVSTSGEGDAGDVTVFADTLTMSGDSSLDSSTFGGGDAGQVLIVVTGPLTVGAPDDDGGSLITSGSFRDIDSPADLGAGGLVRIEAGDITVQGMGAISTATNGGPGGDVEIVADSLTITSNTGVTAETSGPNPAGDIRIQAGTILIDGANSRISSSSFSKGDGSDTGDAGDVTIVAGDITVRTVAGISTTADDASGGRIDVTSTGLLLLEGGSIATSVFDGGDNGGDISIDGALIVLTQGGFIQANAVAGDGGAISISTDGLFTTRDTLIEASSTLGIDGEINIAGLENPETAAVAELPTDFLDANAIVPNPCLAALLGKSELNAGGATGLAAGTLAPEAPAGLLLDPPEFGDTADAGGLQAGPIRIAMTVCEESATW